MRFKKTTLKNGLRIITVPMKDNPTVTVLVLVEAGSKYETKEINGISHFLEHMCFKGTTKRPTNMIISGELDSIGSHYNAFTSHEYTGYYAKAEAKHFSKILDVVSDIYLNPLFDDSEIEKEKGVISDEISMYEDLPGRKVGNVFMDLLYGDQPAGWPITGKPEVVRKFKKKDFIGYRRKHYVAKGTLVVVAGNINEKEAISAIKDKFTGISSAPKGKKVKVKEPQTSPQISLFNKNTDQTHLLLGVRSFDTYNRNNFALAVLSGVLSAGMSSRLFQKIRNEMGVGYRIGAENDSYTDHGIFEVSTGVDNKRVVEVVSAIMAELKKLKEEKVREEELRKVKDNLMGSMILGLESSDSLAEFYGIQEIMRKPILEPSDMEKKINAITAGDIQRVANLIFVNKCLNLALVGPFKEKNVFAGVLKF
ncbi:MAG: pitrilysin family protein [Candidatus Paceibacterota bacterium]|jgi:predicted Zn-dependent peptidase